MRCGSDGQDLLASASDDKTVRLWDPATTAQQRVLTGHTDEVTGVCAVRVHGQDLLASASDDQTVRLWDPATGAPRRVLTGHAGGVNAVCAVRVLRVRRGRPRRRPDELLASAGSDGTVRLWDPATGAQNGC